MKAVIFDFNGTLFLDDDKHIEAWGKMSQLLRGKPVSQYELDHQLNGVPNKKIIEYFTDNRLSCEQVELYSRKKEEIYRQCCLADKKHLKLVDGCEQYFEQLKAAGIAMSICSASIKENIDFFFDVFKLERWFDRSKVIYDNGTYSNKVAMFKDASKVLGVDPKDCLVFEDSYSGINCAKEAGIGKIIVVGNKKDDVDLLCIKDFKEMLD